MDRKQLSIILIALIIIITGFNNKEMRVEFTGELRNQVSNGTDYDISYFGDAIRHIGINEGTSIMVLYAHKGTSIGKKVLDGYVQKNSGNSYVIYVRPGLVKSVAKKVLVHELTHVRQMEEGLLDQKSISDVYWKGEKVDDKSYPNPVNYPHEVDSHDRTKNTIKYLKKTK